MDISPVFPSIRSDSSLKFVCCCKFSVHPSQSSHQSLALQSRTAKFCSRVSVEQLKAPPSRTPLPVTLSAQSSAPVPPECPQHGGAGQRQHQLAGISLPQIVAVSERRSETRLLGGHFHPPEVGSGRRTPQLPLGLRQSWRDPQRRYRGAGGLLLIFLP